MHGIADSEEDPTSRKGRALDLINRSMAIVFVLVSRSDSETAAEAAAVIDLVDAYRSNASIEKEVKVGLSAASWMSLDVQRVYAALTDHEHPDSDVSAGINVQRAIDLIRPIATASARREMDDPASSARAKQLAGNLVTSLATTARISDDVVRLAHSLAIELPSSRASVHEQVTSAIVYGLVALLANSETIAAAASVDGIQETTSPPDADQQLAEPQFEYAPDVVFTTAGRTDDQSDVSTDQSTVSLIQAAEIEIRPIPTPDQVLDTLVAENESLWGRARLLYDSGELSEVAQIDFLSVYESYTRQLDRVEPNLRVLNETVLEVSKWVAEADSSTTQLEIELLANAERLMTTGDDGATGIGKEMAQRVADAVAAELVDPTGGQLRQVESDVLEALGWRDHAADRLEGIEALGYRDSGAVGGFLGGALAFGVTRDPTMIPGGASLGAGKFVVLRAMFGLLRSYFRRRT